MLLILFATLGVDPPKPTPIKVGQPAPYVDALFADGSPFNQDEQKGKFILVTWYSADDETTKKHFVALREARKEFVKEKRLQMISIRMDGEWEEWLKFQEKQPPLEPEHPLHRFYSDFKWWQAFHDSPKERRNPFRVGKKPASFLIGPDGKFAALDVPDSKLLETVKAALAKK